ncbi:MAG: helix-turn-helix transcriptional regulator [Bacteroidales bacterium]|nr:helix-turn-helix transcriptional regulator [Bacteroidales bacterium]
MSDNKTVENRIKAVLADKKRTCGWLAKETGKSVNTVSRWCSNKSQPSIQQLDDIAKALDVDIRLLIKSSNEL